MYQFRIWSPAVCGCKFGFYWDDSLDVDKRQDHFGTLIQRGPEPAHLAIKDPEDLYIAVRAEGHLLSDMSRQIQTLYPPPEDVNGVEFQEHLNQLWSELTYEFDESRILRFSHKRLTSLQKLAIRNYISKNYQGKAVLVG